MKMAKKVLSVVLAVALSLSALAIAVSANGDPVNATYKSEWWITAQKATVDWSGSTVRYMAAQNRTIITPKVKVTYEGADTATQLAVKPGDTVYISVHMVNNYFTGQTSGRVYYSPALLDFGQDFLSQIEAKCATVPNASTEQYGGKMPPAQFKKVVFYDKNNTALYMDGVPLICEADLTMTPWSSMVDENKDNWINWPCEDNSKTPVFDRNDYSAFLFGSAPDMAGELLMTMPSENRDSYYVKFPLTVPSDAAPGTEYKVFMDERTIRRSEFRGGSLYMNNFPDGIVDPDAFGIGNPQYMDKDQYFDLSKATITLKVEGEVAPTINYDELQATYDSLKNKDVTGYTSATVAAFNSALADAKAMLDAKNAQTQDEVTALNTALVNANKNLAALANYSALDTLIASAAQYKAENYTPATFANFTTALNAAKNLSRDLPATEQGKVTKAYNDLDAAIKALDGYANYAALDTAIAKAPQYAQNMYTESSWSAYDTALQAAKAVDRKLPASKQQTVDDLETALTNAYNGLKVAPADYTELDAQIARFNALNAEDYNLVDYGKVQKLAQEGSAISRNLDKTSQQRIDDKALEIKNALDALKPLGKADYSKLDAAIAAVPAGSQNDYTEATWANYAQALANAQGVDRNLNSSEQATVDALEKALTAAKNALVKKANYTALDAAIAIADAKVKDEYTASSWAVFAPVLAEAKAIDRTLTENEQNTIDTLTDKLTRAIGVLEKLANYAKLEAALARYAQYDSADYPADEWAPVKKAYDEAAGVPAGLGVSQQTMIDGKADALTAALDGLSGFASYTKLDAQIAAFDKLVKAEWTADSYAAAKTAYDAAKNVARDLSSKDQAIVDNAATALENAIKNLVPAPADYTVVEEAKNKALAEIAKTNRHENNTLVYSDETIAAVNAAIEAVVEGKPHTEQDAVNAMAAAIDEAVANLKGRPLTPAHYAQTDAYVAEFAALNPDDYTPESYAAAKAVIDGITKDHTYISSSYAQYKLQEDAAHRAVSDDKSGVYNAILVRKEVVVKPANYAALDAAIALVEQKSGYADDYTKASWNALMTIYNNEALTISRNLTENEQGQVDAVTDKLNAALNALKDIADYTVLDNAVAAAQAVERNLYTAATLRVLDAAVAAAADVNRDLDASQQAVINAAAKDITDAIAALKKPAVYTALDEAIASVAEYNKNAYTADTWAAVETALAAGKNVDRNLDEDSQKVIDDAAAAIADALAKLQRKPVNSSITAAELKDGVAIVRSNGRPNKIQFIDEAGSTRTYNRSHEAVTIVSYDAQGNVVNSLDRALAYEVWTIKTTAPAGQNLEAKAKINMQWEDETFAFVGTETTPVYNDAYVSHSVAYDKPEYELVNPGKFSVDVVTGPDARKVQIVAADGSTSTYDVNSSVVGEDGNRTFNCTPYASKAFRQEFTIRVKGADNVWKDADSFIIYTVEPA